MGASGWVLAAVAGSGLLHAGWNAAAHRIADRAAGFVLMGTAFTLVAAVVVVLAPAPAGPSVPFLLASAALQTGYILLLLRSYQLGDFGQVYPLARGTSPLVVGLVAATALGQRLSAVQFTGLAAVAVGLAGIAFGGRRAVRPAPGRPPSAAHAADQAPPRTGAALSAAVGTGLLIAAYTLVDGTGVRRSDSVLGYLGWSFLIQGPAMVVLLTARRGPADMWRRVRAPAAAGLTSGVVSLAAYGIVVWAQNSVALAPVAATRELSILFGAVLGRVLFREPFGAWRIAGAVLTVAGIAALDL